jgi:hypothetical protein
MPIGRQFDIPFNVMLFLRPYSDSPPLSIFYGSRAADLASLFFGVCCCRLSLFDLGTRVRSFDCAFLPAHRINMTEQTDVGITNIFCPQAVSLLLEFFVI